MEAARTAQANGLLDGACTWIGTSNSQSDMKKKLTYIMIEVEVDNSLACIFTSATVGANLFHQTTGAGKVHLRL
jgi:hypothetical protein